MKPRFPLSTKIFLLAFANLAILAIVFLVFARLQFHMRLDSFLTEPARDRIVSVSRQMALDLGDNLPQTRGELLQRYSRMYGATFYLFEPPDTQVAGPAVDVPEAVLRQMRRRPPGVDGPPGLPPGPPPRPRADDAQEPGRGRRGPPPDPAGQPPVFVTSTSNPTVYWAGAGIPLRDHSVEGQMPVFLLMSSSYLLSTPLLFDYKPWLAVSGVMVGVFVLCWLPFIRGLTGAVARMSKATGQIAEGKFDHRVAENGSDELALLAAGINRMALRLSGFVNGQKRFLGDIAHELCAPIARMQFALGILEQRSPPGAVDDLHEEMRQMSTLVGELLLFSKAGMEQSARPLVPVDVAETAKQAIAREGALGFGPREVALSIDAGATVMADPEYLLRSLSNLLRNAMRYAGDAGPIAISARREHGEIAITVADHGPGLPEEEVDRVFTPFYRVETSRNRASGGVGLGLSIVRNCIEACQGTVRCRNRIPVGLEVEIRLPAAS